MVRPASPQPVRKIFRNSQCAPTTANDKTPGQMGFTGISSRSEHRLDRTSNPTVVGSNPTGRARVFAGQRLAADCRSRPRPRWSAPSGGPPEAGMAVFRPAPREATRWLQCVAALGVRPSSPAARPAGRSTAAFWMIGHNTRVTFYTKAAATRHNVLIYSLSSNMQNTEDAFSGMTYLCRKNGTWSGMRVGHKDFGPHASE
jgi:hypothetical protein